MKLSRKTIKLFLDELKTETTLMKSSHNLFMPIGVLNSIELDINKGDTLAIKNSNKGFIFKLDKNVTDGDKTVKVFSVGKSEGSLVISLPAYYVKIFNLQPKEKLVTTIKGNVIFVERSNECL